MLTQSDLKELLHYCPETGEFTWLVSTGPRAQAGSVAGTLSHGYQQIQIQGTLYRAHRLAWLYTHGEFPPEGLDHKNRVKTDNRICNLRPATDAENQQNLSMRSDNTSGHVGVSWNNPRQKWLAQIRINCKKIHLGRFTNIEDAIAARKAAELKYHTFQNEENL